MFESRMNLIRDEFAHPSVVHQREGQKASKGSGTKSLSGTEGEEILSTKLQILNEFQ
jgi:hypothetical protein